MADSLNLAQLAEDSLARLGDHDALIFEGQTLRSAALHERARRVAGGLADLGVEPGERVVVLMANCPEVLVTYNAIWRAGAVVTPVVFLVTAAELGHILADSAATAVVTTPELLATVLEAAATAPSVRHVIVAGGVDAAAGTAGAAHLRRLRRARASRAATAGAAGRRRPGCAHVHGRHHREGQGRRAAVIATSGARGGARGRPPTCPA